jgi:hypothetical protein
MLHDSTWSIAMMRNVIILLLTLVTMSSVSVAEAAKSSTKEIILGDTKIAFEVIRHGQGPVFVALHENETTAIAVAKKLVPAARGTLIVLRHRGERYVTFTLGGDTYQFDPNRIFTAQGIRQTLKGGSAPEAVAAVRALAQAIVSEIGNRPIVALHNNTNGLYSLLSYLPGYKYSGDAQSVHQVVGQDPDDFFFTTEESFYDMAQESGFNVVLQSNRVTDDGSLSVYSSVHGLRYVNVEAEHGHAEVQLGMLQWLSKHWR